MESWFRARLLVLAALLVVLSGVAIYLRGEKRGGEAAPPGLLQTRPDEPAFQPGATGDDLLQLAERTADALVREFPEDPLAWSVQARRHYMLLETDQAVALWRKGLELDPNFAEAYFGLGLVAIDRGEHQEAAERFEDVARLNPEDPRVPVLLGKSLLYAGRAEDAILVLEQHITTQQTTAEAWEMLGQANLQLQRFDRAARCFEVAVAARPAMQDAVYGLSRAYAGLGDSQKAEAYARQFRELSDQSQTQNVNEAADDHKDVAFGARVAGQTYADGARVYRNHRDAARAEDFLLRAALLQPSNPEYLAQLQRSLQQRGAYAEAAEVGEHIVELVPRQVDHWLNLGWLYSHLDQPERAFAACRQAIALNPDDPRCRQAYDIIQKAQ
jgi:tetratricopeptide (TPR) repeat protein